MNTINKLLWQSSTHAGEFNLVCVGLYLQWKIILTKSWINIYIYNISCVLPVKLTIKFTEYNVQKIKVLFDI